MAGIALLVACVPLGLVPTPARATWSIVAVDGATEEVGIAAASCIGGVEVTGGLAPGRGVIAAQALSNPSARDQAVELLAAGASPREVIEQVTTVEFDPESFRSGPKLRQYGVAALGFEAAAASFTGSWVLGWSGSAHGQGVAVQGNLLYGATVVEATLATFEAIAPGTAATLSDRLMAALEAGAAKGGDKRCAKELSALSAFIAVARPGDDARHPYLRIVAPYAGETDTSPWTFLRQLLWPQRGDLSENPVTRLRKEYDRWRERNPRAQERGVVPKASRARERAQP